MRRRAANNVKIFLYSVLSGIKFNLGGQLGANEVLALADSFSIKKWLRLYKDVPDIKKINIAYLVFLIGQIISDILNHSSPSDFIRGWANIIMAIIVTNFLARLLYRSPKLFVAYMIGEAIRFILFTQEIEGSFSDMGYFKFKVVLISNALLLALSFFLSLKSRKGRNIVIIISILYGLISIAFDARSNGIFWILAGPVCAQLSKVKKISFKKVLPYLLLFIIVFQLLYMLYVSAVLSGSLGGKHSQIQFERVANPYNPLALLASGRSEAFVAVSAIQDNPIIGFGSWAPDKGGKYTYQLYQLHGEEERYQALLKSAEGNSMLIPSHSVILGAWLNAGIVGLVAILFIFVLVLKRALGLFRYRAFVAGPFGHIIAYFSLYLLWTFLFSPLPHIKQTLPVIIALILVLNRRMEVYSSAAVRRSKESFSASVKIEAATLPG